MGELSDKNEKSRCCFTDWLRSVACILVLSVHAMVVLQRVLSLNEMEQEISNNYILILLHYGMPVFFYSSGRASYFSTNDSGKSIVFFR